MTITTMSTTTTTTTTVLSLTPFHTRPQFMRFRPSPSARLVLKALEGSNSSSSDMSSSPAPPTTSTRHKQEKELDEENVVVLASMRSRFNEIMVVDTPSSRFLLLDSSLNIHSMLNKKKIWTDSYWDELASLPAIIPPGPIAILGLGAGTTAHLILKLWPWKQLVGWEIDEILVNVARDYFGLSELEKINKSGGSLSIRIGDALSPSAKIEGGFAGIIVDLFSDGMIIPQLHEVKTWLLIAKKLMPNGRIIVNCGDADLSSGDLTASDSLWVQNSTIKALHDTFPGKVSWKRMAENKSGNYLALTGPLPDLETWSSSVEGPLISEVKYWKPCELA